MQIRKDKKGRDERRGEMKKVCKKCTNKNCKSCSFGITLIDNGSKRGSIKLRASRTIVFDAVGYVGGSRVKLAEEYEDSENSLIVHAQKKEALKDKTKKQRKRQVSEVAPSFSYLKPPPKIVA